MEEVVLKLIELGKTISTMESCTGGGVANAITNVSGASEILKFSAVTYSNEYKIKMGVSSDTISKYTVYSSEVAREMSKSISIFADSDYGIGITGKINRADINNPGGNDSLIFVSIYDKSSDKYHEFEIEAIDDTRARNKDIIIKKITDCLFEIISDIKREIRK